MYQAESESKLKNKMQPHKRYIIILSIVSLVSSILIGSLTLLLLVTDSPLNITTNCISGMKVGTAAGLVHCLMNFLLYSLYAPTNQDSKFRIQITNILKCCILLCLACIIFYIIAICFGAPFLKLTSETLHFALLLTVLVCLPFCLLFGPNIEVWLETFGTKSAYVGLDTVVSLTSSCALLGSWLGALPIPLDWDRPWQIWPISCVAGALGGYSIGLLLSAVQLPRKYRALNKSKFF